MDNEMKELIRHLASEAGNKRYRTDYKEGRDLLNKVIKKVADKYDLSVLCLCSRSDSKHHSMSFIQLDKIGLANFMASLLGNKHGKNALKLMPARLVAPVLGRIKFLYIFCGASTVFAGYLVSRYLMH